MSEKSNLQPRINNLQTVLSLQPIDSASDELILGHAPYISGVSMKMPARGDFSNVFGPLAWALIDRPAGADEVHLLSAAKYSDHDVRSAGILPAVSGASRSRSARGQDAHATAGETPALRKQHVTIFGSPEYVSNQRYG